ncbi:MAG: hypothetical protein KDC24_07435 [Saprospiraceae bacterium]|nr:hypothetical protein [Saprospiraceae bacterium]
MRILTVILVGLVAGAIFSCTKDNLNPGRIIRIDDDFNLTIWEGLNPDTRDIQVLVTTNTPLDCENYTIDLGSVVNSNAIKIRLNGVIPPENCIVGEGHPRDTISFGNLPNRVYNFEVLIGGEISNIGSFEISDEKIETTFSQTNGFSLSNESLNRIVPELYWGKVTYTPGNEVAANNLIDSLANIAVNETILSGNYGRFVLTGSTVSIPSDTTGTNVTSFVFKIEEPESKVLDIFNQFKQDYPDDLIIEAWNGKGSAF